MLIHDNLFRLLNLYSQNELINVDKTYSTLRILMDPVNLSSKEKADLIN
jgi:hypothetical protein